MNKLSQREIKETVLKYLDDNAVATYSDWRLAFYTKDRGVYSGVTQSGSRVFGFVVDFAHKYFSIEGITGKKLNQSASNLNMIFGYGRYLAEAAENDATLAKFSKLGNALGNIGSHVTFLYGEANREENNIGRGILRAITEFPVSEQLTEATWLRQYDYADANELRKVLETIQKKIADTGINNIRKAYGFSVSQWSKVMGLNDVSSLKSYLALGRDGIDQIDTIYSIAEQVDKERGYHDAKAWSSQFAKNLMNYAYFKENFNLIVGQYNHDTRQGFNNLIRYLYGSCYHQQALEPYDAVKVLVDYYRLTQGDRNPVKYPRYLKTAHDVATANFNYVHSTDTEQGVIENYSDHKQLETAFNNYGFFVAASAAEIVDEANQQSNCVAGYISCVAKQATTIMFMRNLKSVHTSEVTFEVRDNAVVQAYSTYNRPLNYDQSEGLRQFAKKKGFSLDLNSVMPIEVDVPHTKTLPEFHSDDDLGAVKRYEDNAVTSKDKKFDSKVVAA